MINPPQMREEKVWIAYEILEYLNDNPNAQDTLEGIVEWWLLERTINQQTLAVEEALSMLVTERLILAHQGVDSRTRYKLNSRRRRKIRLLLQRR
jgi:hypothetical protein